MSSTLDAPKKAKAILLTTYKRDGAPVATPVSIAFDGDRAFFRSSDEAWKTKRLRNNPSVDVAPATLRGSRRVQPFMRGQRSWRAAKPSLRATR